MTLGTIYQSHSNYLVMIWGIVTTMATMIINATMILWFSFALTTRFNIGFNFHLISPPLIW